MSFTAEQLHRRTEFRTSISAAITAGTVRDATIANADLHMVADYLRDYIPTDWTDLTTDSQEELAEFVQLLRESIEAYPNQRDAMKQNNSKLCLIRYGTIYGLITEAGSD